MNVFTRLISGPLGLLLPLSLIVAGCSGDDSRPNIQTDIEAAVDTVPTDVIVGNDRDARGCIASAGYVWSGVLSDCVRLFEVGIPLDNQQDPASNFVTYLIVGDAERLELFAPASPPVTLTSTGLDTWGDADSGLTATRQATGFYTVYQDGAVLYSEGGDAQDNDYATDTLTETGILTELEDGAYPFYSVTLAFPKNQSRASFTLNAEAVAVDMAELYAHLNQTISIDYVSNVETDVMEIELGSEFLYGTDSRDALQDYQSISGILRDASVTMGDLPGTFYLEDANGNRTEFEEYVTEDMLVANDQPVIIYYSERFQNTIIAIDLGMD